MLVSASRVFDFLNENVEVTIVRHEIALPAFSILRRSLRQIVLRLHDSYDPDAIEVSRRLRVSLSEWLTAPVPFDDWMQETVTGLFGRAESVETRWGADIQTLYNEALHAMEHLIGSENPIRDELRTEIRGLRSQGQTLKVYCHRRARQYFQSLFEAHRDLPLEEEAFLHSVRDYRETNTFGTLLKVGPLRSRGWGSAPDALITAPRFSNLVQIVWSGSNDEEDFGYDPVSALPDSASGNGTSSVSVSPTGYCPVKWRRQVIRTGEDATFSSGDTDDVDELHLFREIQSQGDKRPAIHLQIDDTHGVLYPPFSKVLSFDPDRAARNQIDHRVPGESLVEGMFLILPLVDDVDFDGVRAEHGHYSRIWKLKLEQEFQANANGLIGRLREAGLNLVHLGTAIKHWCRSPTTVIPAPQQMRHFKILLEVMGLSDTIGNELHRQSTPLWQAAWTEVRRSRGEAIQAGVQAHEIVEEELLETLRRFASEIQYKASHETGFNIVIPAEDELQGLFFFFKIVTIERGFRVPEIELRTIRELNEIDQWRE